MNKRKRELKKLKIPELPLELWVMIGEVGGPEVWLVLILSIPDMGRYSLHTQKKMKTEFGEWNIFKKEGKIITKTYRLPNGMKHREDGPAFIQYYKNGNKKEEQWWKDNKRHREDGSARIIYYENGNKWREEWYKDDKRHREDEPASIEYYENGNKCVEEWHKDDKIHREYGPAMIRYSRSGIKWEEQWYKDGELHREYGPALIYYYTNGRKKIKWWYNKGRRTITGMNTRSSDLKVSCCTEKNKKK